MMSESLSPAGNRQEKAVDFTGPLFIVGMPRSGTKLLRELLNQHPHIGIPPAESHFLPSMIEQFGLQLDLEAEEAFNHFYRDFSQTSFFWNMESQGMVLAKDELRSTADLRSWASIFETILRFYAPPGKEGEFLWGDKTPGYLRHMPLLRQIYPRARFLHIIRDPRDYCLSVNNAWNKNMFRAADVWQKSLDKALVPATQLGPDYKEVKYEDLLENPREVLTTICRFLDCAFDERMLTLTHTAENLGAAKGHTEILRTNKGKFEKQLSVAQTKRIEEIVYPTAKRLGYEINYADHQVPLNALHLKAYNLYDGWASVRFHIGEKGFTQGISYFFNLHKRSSWH